MKRYLLFLLLLLFLISACSTRERSDEMAPDADPDNVP